MNGRRKIQSNDALIQPSLIETIESFLKTCSRFTHGEKNIFDYEISLQSLNRLAEEKDK